MIDRMLKSSAGLDARITNSLRVSDDGRVYIVPNEVRIANVARKIAFGLYCHRYSPRTLPSLHEFFVLSRCMANDANNFIVVLAHTEKFRPRRWSHVQTIKPYGHHKVQVFDYMFVRNWYQQDFGRLFCVRRRCRHGNWGLS